jgi:hypothetical protein
MLEVNGIDGTYSRMLRTDGIGHWRDETGAMLAELTGCLDVDIQATPFTNLLPIRRLKQKAGQQNEIGVVYIEVPSLIITRARQRYTCVEPLRPGAAGEAGKYLYEGPIGDFKAELPVSPTAWSWTTPGSSAASIRSDRLLYIRSRRK